MRLAHLSDPHLLSLEGSRARDFLNKRWIGGMNLLFKRARQHSPRVFEELVADLDAQAVDHVLCTGDVTNLALASEMCFAVERFAEIRLDPGEVTVLPGNHDAYVAEGVELFARHFGVHFACDPGWEWPGDDPWPVVRVRGDVAIIALSTSLPTPWFRAWGKLGDEQLARLDAVLADARLNGKLRLVALHHPPVGKPARSRGAGLRDREAFIRAIATRGAELVLHGHEHLDLRGEIEPATPGRPVTPVRGIQSVTYVGRSREMRARYRIYELSAPGASEAPRAERPSITGTELRVWDDASGTFAPDLDD